MAKKQTRIQKLRKAARKRWMKAVAGSVSYKYVSLFIFGIGMVSLSAAAFVYIRTQGYIFSRPPAITHTTEVPDTGELLRYINQERTSNHKSELTADDKLKSLAEKRLNEMVERQQYSHKDKAGKFYYDYLPDLGYVTKYSCENLDIEPSVKPIRYIQSWVKSDGGHKECLLNENVTRVGLASGKFSRDDKSFLNSYLVVAIFAADPQDPAEGQ